MDAGSVGYDGISEVCHRCGAELAVREWAGEGGFFCPHCGAPQILLPEHLRAEAEEAIEAANAATSGVAAPPAPREVHWRTALRYGSLVALGGGALTALGMISPFVSFLGFLWVVSAGVVVLGFYQKQRPAAQISVRAGFRIGVATGILMSAALAFAFGTAGLVARFGTHRMSAFDVQMDENARNARAWVSANLSKGGEDREVDQKLSSLLNSPEYRAGETIAGAGLQAALLILITAVGGAFAAKVGKRRQSVREVP